MGPKSKEVLRTYRVEIIVGLIAGFVSLGLLGTYATYGNLLAKYGVTFGRVTVHHKSTGEVLCTGRSARDAVVDYVHSVRRLIPPGSGETFEVTSRETVPTELERLSADRRRSYTQLEHALLDGVDFSNADLNGAHLQFSELRRADFSGAQLRGVMFSGTNLHEAKLMGANLEFANVDHAEAYDANFRGANLRGAFLRRINLDNANLSGADLSGANCRHAEMRAIRFDENTRLAGTDLRRARSLTPEFIAHARAEGALLDEALPETP